MPQTERSMFQIEIVRNNTEGGVSGGKGYNAEKIKEGESVKYGCVSLKAVGAKLSTNTICVDGDEAFHLEISRVDKNDDTTYGAVLYLDGQRVHGKKTFRKRTMYPCFKLGGG